MLSQNFYKIEMDYVSSVAADVEFAAKDAECDLLAFRGTGPIADLFVEAVDFDREGFTGNREIDGFFGSRHDHGVETGYTRVYPEDVPCLQGMANDDASRHYVAAVKAAMEDGYAVFYWSSY